jgi:LacI family transcriptional regulator, galactose operon repressor
MESESPAARPPTIVDVARRAGVSKSTVSNVTRGLRNITPETQLKVTRAIEELGYRPNVLARQIVHQRTIFGVVVVDLANPCYAEMAKQIERSAAVRGYRVMFCNTQGEEAAEIAGLEGLLEQRVAGIIFLAHAGGSTRPRTLLEGRVPAVFVTCSAEWGDVVCADDERGARLATEHLIGLGHHRITYCADPIVEDATDRARQAGYRQTMAGAGLTHVVFRWARAEDRLLREATVEQIMTGPCRPTAFVSSNDLGAIDLLDCADRLAVPVPRKLSVVGFDDVVMAGLPRINLTTIAQPKEMLARLAVDTLANRIEGHLRGDPVRQTVSCRLIVRGSTARPPRSPGWTRQTAGR